MKEFYLHYSGLKVSRDGEVLVPKCNGHAEHYTYGCETGSGYRIVKYKGKQYLVHRLVAEVFLNNKQPIQDGYDVHHIDEDPTNNTPENLTIMTHSEHNRLHMMGNQYWKNITTEGRQKIIEAHKGRIVSEETRKKISEAQKGEKHHFYGKQLSEEHRKKISEGGMGKHSIPIIGTNMKTGEVKEFSCGAEAAKTLGISQGNISSCLTGKPHFKSAGGWMWQYA